MHYSCIFLFKKRRLDAASMLKKLSRKTKKNYEVVCEPPPAPLCSRSLFFHQCDKWRIIPPGDEIFLPGLSLRPSFTTFFLLSLCSASSLNLALASCSASHFFFPFSLLLSHFASCIKQLWILFFSFLNFFL